MPAGTLLWAASTRQSARPMSLRIWRSGDIGRTWTYLSSCAVAGNARGLWEPEFSIAADGQLVCHYADETDPAHSQKLVEVRSRDGTTWTDRRDTVSSADGGHRPGMPVVRRLPNGSYVMTYEICGIGGQYDCVVHVRTSPDGWNWGHPTDLGWRPETVDGKYFVNTPTIAWAPTPGGGNGNVLLIGMSLRNRNGTVAADNGRVMFGNTDNATGYWYEIPAPVPVSDPYNNHCTNYSSPLVPSADGRQVSGVATDFHAGGDCGAFFHTGSAVGSGDAAGVADRATYRLVSVQSAMCLDVAGDSRDNGGNVQQWHCNGLGPQDWIVTARGGGYVTLRGENSGRCLEVAGAATTAGANVQQWDCHGGGNQDWRVVNVGRGYYSLVGRDSGLCLDVAGGSKSAGGNIQIWHCNDLHPQIWRVERR